MSSTPLIKAAAIARDTAQHHPLDEGRFALVAKAIRSAVDRTALTQRIVNEAK